MMKINDENIGKFFQDQLKDVEVQPDEAVWSAIKQQSGISSGLSGLAKAALFTIGAAIVVSSYFLWQQIEDMNQVPVVQQIEEPRVVETIILDNPHKVEEVKPEIEVAKKEEKVNVVTTSPKMVEKINKTNKQAKEESNGSKQSSQEVKPITKSNSNKIKAESKELKPEEEIYQAHYIEFGGDSDIENPNIEVLETETVNVNSDTAKIVFSDNPTICFGEDAKLSVVGGVTYDWSNGENTPSIKVSPVEQSDYWVIVTGRNANEIKHTFTVYIDKECTAIFVPSAFTPNGDGINDVFKAEGIGIQYFEMIIFNREGQIVFESHNIADSWDGTYRNQVAKPRMYFYQISYTDAKGNKHNKRGQVTLIK